MMMLDEATLKAIVDDAVAEDEIAEDDGNIAAWEDFEHDGEIRSAAEWERMQQQEKEREREREERQRERERVHRARNADPSWSAGGQRAAQDRYFELKRLWDG